ncbi:30S ribosomal protein S20 [Candidatus Peregrinibacteria bacterium]|nr:MAG: 30S ribosomal protein S20 [Candidatus Peregrinibacteria bacterium]
MPIIKSAKKRAKQSLVRQARNYNVRTAVRKSMRSVMDAVKAGDKAEAEKMMSTAYKQIDLATKKNVLQKNTAARRKSLLARSVATVVAKKKAEK